MKKTGQEREGLTASASGLTPFSIMDMQMDRVRLSRWQFCCFSCASRRVSCSLPSRVGKLGVADD